MKKSLLFLLIIVHTGLSLYAQNWQPVGRGTSYGAVRCIYADTLANRLYIGGNFSLAYGYTDTVIVNGIAYWDGSGWFPLGVGDTGCSYSSCPNPILAISRYGTDIYAGGFFTNMGGIPNTRNLARWDGSNWNSVAGGLSTSSLVINLKEKNNKLYVMGAFTSISGVSANSIALWDGANFSSVNNFPEDNPGGPNFITSFDSLNGALYVGGNFENTTSPALQDIARWDGSQWLPLENGILGGFGSVNDIAVYKNELYVAGWIKKADGNIGDGIIIWNGSSWREFSPNLYWGSVFDLSVINNVLYIAGGFSFVGNPTEYGLAKYDGTTFSAFGGASCWAYGVAGLNGNLYISTNDTINTDTVHYIAQWMGGSSVDSSITVLSGISNIANENNFIIYPNPTQSQIIIEFDLAETKNTSIEIKNILGQTLRTISNTFIIGNNKIVVDLHEFLSGLYIIRLQNGNSQICKKLIKQ